MSVEIPGNLSGCKCPHPSHFLGGGHPYDEVPSPIRLVVVTTAESTFAICEPCETAGHSRDVEDNPARISLTPDQG